jgi:hypothetical protein
MIVKLTSNEQALDNLVGVLDDEFSALSDREVLAEARLILGGVVSTVANLDRIVACVFPEGEDIDLTVSPVFERTESGYGSDHSDCTKQELIEGEVSSLPHEAITLASITDFDALPPINQRSTVSRSRNSYAFSRYRSYLALLGAAMLGAALMGTPTVWQLAKATFKSAYDSPRLAGVPTFLDRWWASSLPGGGKWYTAQSSNAISNGVSIICYTPANSILTSRDELKRVCPTVSATDIVPEKQVAAISAYKPVLESSKVARGTVVRERNRFADFIKSTISGIGKVL